MISSSPAPKDPGAPGAETHGQASSTADPEPAPHRFPSLNPVVFLDRAAVVHADRPAVVDQELHLTYREFADRCRRLAGGLRSMGIAPGDRVAVLAANSHEVLEAHYGVPYAAAVLVTLNTRLNPNELAGIVAHSGARVLLHDPPARAAAIEIARQLGGLALLETGPDYERLLAGAPSLVAPAEDEFGLLALNYTSGTTGRPKGVMYHPRGAYLQSLAMNLHFGLDASSVYLWTLPMFHCNGWCFTWAVTAAGGTHVCLARPDPAAVREQLRRHRVTHLCAAPTVLAGIVDHDGAPLAAPVQVAVGGAPPTPALLERSADQGFELTHLYGLTESFGPAMICDPKPEWAALPLPRRAQLQARQGVPNVLGGQVRVMDPDGHVLPADGQSVGEIMLRGNNVMTGYYRDPEATAATLIDGWLRTGDLGVVHPDGYVQLRDRAKDVIISGGENISSVEVEAVLAAHPAVSEAAVVAAPDERWGERPVAWVSLRAGTTADPEELRAFVRDRLAGFKVPDRVLFGELPKTASGKIRKVELRARLRGGQ